MALTYEELYEIQEKSKKKKKKQNDDIAPVHSSTSKLAKPLATKVPTVSSTYDLLKTYSPSPVAPTVTTSKKKTDTKKSHFDDGYDFGDITRTILGTPKASTNADSSSFFGTDKKEEEKKLTFDEAMRQKYSVMSLAEIEKEYSRIKKEEKEFKEKNGGKFLNYLSKTGSYIGEGMSGQSGSAARAQSQANIDKINDYTREKEIINTYRKKRATEEYLGGLSKEQLQLLDNISKSDDLENAAPIYLATADADTREMQSVMFQKSIEPETKLAEESREKLYKQLKKKNPKKSDDELYELIDNMVELRKSQVNAQNTASMITDIQGNGAASEFDPSIEKKVGFATEHPIASFILSRGASFYGGLTGLYELYNQRNNEYGLDTNAAGFSLTRASQAIDEQVQLDHDWELEVGNEKVDAFDLFYNVGSSAVDNLSRLAMAGGNTTIAGAMMFPQIATQSIIEGKEKGYSDSKALTLALLNGTFEAISEAMSLDAILGSSGGVLKTLAKSFVAEGSEEVTSNWLNRIAEQVANGKHSDLSKMYEAYKNEGYTDAQAMAEVVLSMVGEDTESFLTGGLAGAIMGGGVATVNAVANAKQKNAPIELTENEQKVVDKVVEDRIAEATEENDGKAVSKRKEKEIRQAVLRDLEKGYIDTDTIESVLGGEEYENYKKNKDSSDETIAKGKELIETLEKSIEELQQEYDELNKVSLTEATLGDKNRQAQIEKKQTEIQETIEKNRAILEGLENDTRLSDLKTKLGQNVFETVKDSKLAESYKEIDRHNQVFSADAEQYENEYAKKTVQNAIDFRNNEGYGIDNTNASHDFVDMMTKYATDREVEIVFTTTKGLAELKKNGNKYGIKADPNEINAFVSKEHKKMFLNMDTGKNLYSLVGHEVTHTVVNAKSLGKLNDVVKAFLGEAEYRKIYDKKDETYKRQGLNLTKAEIEEEIVADFCGEKLLTDYDFVMHLATNEQNIFQKAWDSIKYLYKMATAGSKEARQLEKAKRIFEKAYRESAKNTATGTKHSLSDNNITNESTGYASGESYYTMSYKQDGKVVGTLEYGVYEGQPNVKMIEVEPEYRRQGIGTKLMQELQKRYPDEEIGFGMATPDGTKLLESITYDVTDEAVVSDREKLKALQTELNDLQEKLDVLYDIENPTESDRAEVDKLGNRWNEVYDTIYKLEKDLRGKRATKTFVKTDTKYSISAKQEAYFKDSKVRDENGNLKVMYHGTSKGGHTVFDTYGSNYGLMGTGSYFTDNKSVAESYTNKGKGNNKQVYESYLNITNPLDMDAQGNAEEWAKAFPDVDFPESGTNEQFYRAVEEFYSDQMMPKWEVAEEIRESIQFGMGYDGITHIGGGRFNKNDDTRHQVYIAFEPEQIKNIDNIAPTKDADIRYSLTETDNKYLDAVNRGDTETAQRMVDEVAKNSGYSYKVYHGTKNAGFTRFEYSPERQTGTDFGKAYYFTTDYKKAQGYSYDVEKDLRVQEYKSNRERLLQKFLETESEEDKNNFLNYKQDGKTLFELMNDESYTTDGGEVKELFLKIDNPLRVNARGKYYYEVYEEYFNRARINGNDGIIVKNVIDNPRGEHRPIDVYITFNSNQMKSADPITYDDNGNVIPLSERFKAENNDIRYSLGDTLEKNGKLSYNSNSPLSIDNRAKTNNNSSIKWVYDAEIFSVTESKQFHSKISEINQGSEAFSQNSAGEYMIPIENKIVFTDGNYDSPYVREVIEVLTEYQTEFEKARERIFNVEKGKSEKQDAVRTLEQVFGKGFIVTYRSGIDGVYDWQNGKPKGKSRSTVIKNYLRKQYRAGNDNQSQETPINEIAPIKETSSEDGVFFDAEKTKYSLSDSEGRELSKEQQEYFKSVSPLLKDESGNIKRYYHGTARGDRVGTYFNPERATSGPMAFFTDNPEIAEGYSKSKADTSMSYDPDYDSYETQFRVNINGNDMSLINAWRYLPMSARARIKERAEHTHYDWEDYETLVYDEETTEANGGFSWQLREARGNVLQALNEQWLNSGTLFREENKYLDVLKFIGVYDEFKKLGYGEPYYKDPFYREEKVFEVYLNVTNPFHTADVDEEFLNDARDWVDNTDLSIYESETADSDLWDKRSLDPYEWLDRLESDIENETTHAWTSIPDVITDFLKEYGGYDGIVDAGGKHTGYGHQVVIPFYSEQIKNIDNETPTTDVHIDLSLSEDGETFGDSGNLKVYAKDIMTPTDIAPVKSTVSETEKVEDIAPTKEYEAIEPRPDALSDEEEQWARNKMARADTEAKPTRRSELHGSIIDRIKTKFTEKGFDFDEVLNKAKNLTTVSTNDNTPQRVMEKALGYKQGQILADETVNKVAQNETEGIKWLNSFTDRKNGVLAQISKQYNIKPGSKKSAAAQMYAEGFYVTKDNKIVKYGDEELAIDFPDVKVQANIKGLARDERIRQIYDETLEAINESRRRNLYPEIQKLDNYFLHFRAMEDTFSRLGLPFNPNDIRAHDLPTDLNGVTADLKPGQPYFASAMHREGMRTSFDLLGGLERYLSSAKNQIYHIDDIQNLRALRNYIADTYGQAKGLESLDSLSEEEAQERITQVYNSHLSTFAKFLHEEANILAGKKTLIDRGIEGAVGRKWFAFFDTVNRQVGSNMVGFNVSSSLTNFLPVAQTFAKTNKFDFTKAFAQTVSSKIGSIFGKTDSFVENNPTIIRRKGAERFYRTPFQKVGDAGYVLMSAVDDVSTELIVRTKYNELIRKGMDEQKASFETDKWVSRLMGDRSLGQMPLWYNSKMLGLVTKFQLEVRNQLDSQFYDTVQEAKVSNEEIENKLLRNAKTAAKVTSTFFQLAVVQHLFGKAFESVAGYNPAFDIIEVLIKTLGLDDDEEDEDTVLDNLEEGFFALLEDLPYTSTFMDGGRIPISSALPVSELIKGEDQYGNEKSRWDTIKEVAPYYVLPTGYGQIKKTAQGIGMFSDDHPVAGSYTDSGNLRFPVEKTPGNVLQSAVFGQYANKNARTYFDEGYAPLKEKQIQEYKEADMPIADYWKYREGLKDFDKQDEKAAYINGLDISNKQKNVLKSYLYDEEGYKEENPEKYAFLEREGIGYIGYKEADEDTQSAWSWAFKHQDEYEYYKKNGVYPGDYSTYYIPMLDFEDDDNDAYSWAFNNPEKATFSKAITDNVVDYRKITSELYSIRADKDKNGKTINGSAKKKKKAYIWGLDIDEEAKYILFKNEYPSFDDKNREIVEYLINRDDLSYDEVNDICEQLGYKVNRDTGDISWD